MQVIIMQGISGSGKSTYTRRIIAGLPPGASFQVVSADHFFLDASGNYKFDPTRLGNAHLDCQKRFLEACQTGIDTIIVDNTNLRLWEISPYRTIALLHGYDVRILRVCCEPKIAASRNNHGVPEKSVLNQAKNMEDIPRAWGKEEFIYHD